MSQTRKKIVRLVVISDTHGHHDWLTESMPASGDVLIHLGDFCNRGSRDDAFNFVEWFSKLPGYKEKFVIGGNHDRTVKPTAKEEEINLQEIFSTVENVRFLQEEFVQTQDGLGIYGAKWGGDFERSFPFHNYQVDVFLSHINPRIKKTVAINQTGFRGYKAWRGEPRVSHTVLSNRIPLCLSGHVHWGRGVVQVHHDDSSVSPSSSSSVSSSSSIFVNAASLKSSRDGIMHKPVVIDYDLIQKRPVRIDCTYEVVPSDTFANVALPSKHRSLERTRQSEVSTNATYTQSVAATPKLASTTTTRNPKGFGLFGKLVNSQLRTNQQVLISEPTPLAMQSQEENSVGYYVADDMDIDEDSFVAGDTF